MSGLNPIQVVAVVALPLLFAITLHEVAHGWMARRLGDPTAMMMGRLTLNPIKHVDPIGTVVVPLALLFFTGFIFGWAKPVPVTWENLKHPRRDMTLVAVAGPLSNLLMAAFWALVVRAGMVLMQADVNAAFLTYAGVAGVFFNLILAALNLLPMPPLDGGRVMSGLLPPKMSWNFGRIEPFGFPILVVLLFTGILGAVIFTLIEWVLPAYAVIAGITADNLWNVFVVLFQ